MSDQLTRLAAFPAFAGLNNAALTAALQSLPDYDQHEAGKQRIAVALQLANTELLTAAQARLALVQQVANTASEDKPQSKDLARQAAKAADALTHARETVALLEDADRALAEGRDLILASAPDAILQHLGGQLQTALVEARAAGLGEVSTADEAIEAGKVDAWRTVTRLTAVALEIRSAQQLVMAHLTPGSDVHQHLATFGAIRNYAELFPKWFARQRGEVPSYLNGQPEEFSPPWSETSPEGVWLYAVQHREVELWVPTPGQLRDAYAAARAEQRDIENAEAREAEGASLTAEERKRLELHRHLERRYLTGAAAKV